MFSLDYMTTSESINARKGIKTKQRAERKQKNRNNSESINARKGIKTETAGWRPGGCSPSSESINARKGIKTSYKIPKSRNGSLRINKCP